MIKNILFVVIFLFGGCAFRSLSDTVESIYTDEEVVKPTSANYKLPPSSTNRAILKEEVVAKSPEDIAKEQTKRFKAEGYIRSFSYDPDVKLYIYNFVSKDNQELVFFYDKKLPYTYGDLVKVDVRDNFLMGIKAQNSNTSTQTLTPTQKRKLIIKKRKKSKIREAVEEKINTL